MTNLLGYRLGHRQEIPTPAIELARVDREQLAPSSRPALLDVVALEASTRMRVSELSLRLILKPMSRTMERDNPDWAPRNW
ncbi:hypothetical protein [Mesorhizobium sp. M0006]|uniref:hypothetical protein n=1 Tax=unclassified Mesorhizobium TaxID=325217 RepID=UPI00333812C4